MDEELKKEIIELIQELRQQDSIEVGNAKTGVMKVYFNADKKDEALRKIQNAKELLMTAKAGILE
jgi:hypothetical protein